MKYLEVLGHDNDFGGSLTDALAQIWYWVNKNNGHMLAGDDHVAGIFQKVHEGGILKSIILRAWVLHHMLSYVEHKLRGLYGEVDWSRCEVSEPICDNLSEYLSFELAFHEDKSFTEEWQNGEHAWLDLETGEAGTF